MIIHTVKRGDTLFSVAGEYAVPVSRIVSDNLLGENARLVVGQDLVITNPVRTYTVRGGDTLTSIAASNGVSLLSLYQNNPFLNGAQTIFPGQTLTIEREAPVFGSAAVNGYAYPFIDKTVLRRTLPYLTYLSIFTYGIKNSGELIEPQGDVRELIAIAREYDATPLMMLTSLTEQGNFSNELVTDILSSAELSDRVIEDAARVMAEDGYGGIDVDFEYIGGEYADAYISFLNRLKSRIGDSYSLFVSLAPKNRDDQPGILYEGHDYSGIGEIADRNLVMTYEWGYTYGPPNAVSPINEVRGVLEYAASRIPGEKILMGFPNYGYDWPLPYVRGETKAETLTNVGAVVLAGERGAEILFDQVRQAPYFRYFDRPESFSDSVEHEVWFSNARNCDSLLRLINELGLYGTGVWNIMNYYPSLWQVLMSLYSIIKL